MSMIFLTFREYMDARDTLSRMRASGIRGKLGRTPGFLAKNGCGYGIYVREADYVALVERGLIQRAEKVYRHSGRTYRELRL